MGRCVAGIDDTLSIRFVAASQLYSPHIMRGSYTNNNQFTIDPEAS
jgi:hypothetical protein